MSYQNYLISAENKKKCRALITHEFETRHKNINIMFGDLTPLVVLQPIIVFNDRNKLIKLLNVKNNVTKLFFVAGIITTKERLDREYRSSYSLFAEAKDQGTPPKSSRVPVQIKITDVNDNSPEIIDPREDVVSVREEQQPGAEVARVKAIDRDNGVNSTVTYSILNERDSDGYGVFSIDSKTGVIKTSTGEILVLNIHLSTLVA